MAQNLFRFLGDWLHMVAILMILHRLFVVKNAQGISRKTQELCLATFLCRYVDLLTTFYSAYNSLMKIFFIISTASCVYVMTSCSKHPAADTYRSDQDGSSVISHWTMVGLPCLVLTIVTLLLGSSEMHDPDFLEMLWTNSLYLEACACIPQIIMFRKYRQVESLSGGAFIFMMGAYRGLYGLNWIYRSHTERGYQHHWLVYTAGFFQFAICMLGLFWPATEESAPLMPQLKRLLAELKSAKSGVALTGTGCLMMGAVLQGWDARGCNSCKIALVIMTLVYTAFTARLWFELGSRKEQVCAVLSCLILWGPLVGVSFALIACLVLACCMVSLSPPELLGFVPTADSDDDDGGSSIPPALLSVLLTDAQPNDEEERKEEETEGIVMTPVTVV